MSAPTTVIVENALLPDATTLLFMDSEDGRATLIVVRDAFGRQGFCRDVSRRDGERHDATLSEWTARPPVGVTEVLDVRGRLSGLVVNPTTLQPIPAPEPPAPQTTGGNVRSEDMTLLDAIEAITAGDAQRIVEPGEWKVYRSGGDVVFARSEDGWMPRIALASAAKS